MMDVVKHYTPEAQEARERLLRLIEAERNAFLERIEPYQKMLVSIESTTRQSYVLTSDEMGKLQAGAPSPVDGKR